MTIYANFARRLRGQRNRITTWGRVACGTPVQLATAFLNEFRRTSAKTAAVQLFALLSALIRPASICDFFKVGIEFQMLRMGRNKPAAFGEFKQRHNFLNRFARDAEEILAVADSESPVALGNVGGDRRAARLSW